MELKIKTTQITERWDCHGCGNCCRGPGVDLSKADLQKLRQQGWHRLPDFLHLSIVRRTGFLKKTIQLAHHKDGTCVFLMTNNRCRIHRELGEEAKPLTCRSFPFQFVPFDKSLIFTLRRCCPSAAADNGRELHQHMAAAKELAKLNHDSVTSSPPPFTSDSRYSSWPETIRFLNVLDRLILQGHSPLNTRIQYGLELCNRIEKSHYGRNQKSSFGSMLDVLEAEIIGAAEETPGQLSPPIKTAPARSGN